MGYRYELRLSGDVGHGLILIGKILAEAAAIYDGLNAIQTQSYGEESRGEANRSEVIISDEDIVFPKVERPDLLLCLSQVAHDRYIDQLKSDGFLIIDSQRVLDFSDDHEKLFSFPFFQTALDEFKDESMASSIALGVVADLLGVVSPRAVHLALRARIPKGSEEMNEKALKRGYQMAKEKLSSTMMNPEL
ncbi:MAG: 2-oxoacid:acceptor oxidoreductase family protein [bacterium]|nr:MAG: 2-oxoacid:acceptor oxidoreductase family protein [bacterium]